MGKRIARHPPAGAPRPASRAARALALLAGLAAALLLLAPMLTYRFGRDQGVFACAADVLRHGGVLYRDFWDLKPPGVYYLYWLAISVFGHSMLAPRLLDLLFSLATAAAIALIGKRLLSLSLGVAAAFLFLSRYALGFDYWHTAQGDGLASLPLALAVLAALAAERRRSWPLAAASGALIGAAVVIKFTLAALLVLPLLALLLARRERWSARLLRGAAYLLGCAVVVGAVVLLVWRAGALRDMIQIIFTWNARYAAIRPAVPASSLIPYQTARFLLGGRHLILSLIGALALVGLADSLRRGAGPLRWLAPAWLAAMLLQVWAQGKYFQYHWLPALPPLGLLAAQGLSTLWRLLTQRLAPRPARAVAALAALALLAALASGYWVQFHREIRYAVGALPPAEFLTQFCDRQDYSLPADLEVAAFLRAHSPPGRPAFIWGFEPTIYFLAGLPPATRFISQQPLMAPWSPPEWRRELLRDLEDKQPDYLLVLHNDFMPWVTMRPYDSAGELVFFPELTAFIQRDYRLTAVIEDFDIWERR